MGTRHKREHELTAAGGGAPPVHLLDRLRDLAVDGLLVALPVAVVLVLLGKLINAMAKLFAPLAGLLPNERWFGIALLDVIATVALLLALVVIGILGRTRLGHIVSERLEHIVLRKFPGYLLFKSLAAGFSSTEHEAGLTPALVNFDDHAELGFIVENASTPAGMVTVFIPAAPTPAAGNVVLVPSSRVVILDIPVSKAMHSVKTLGLGLQELTNGALLEDAPSPIDPASRKQ